VLNSWQEISVAHGALQLAARVHGESAAPPLIALHGWRDNSASFELLAPLLPHARMIAMDFPGHGLSSPRSGEAHYYIWSYLADVLALVDGLNLSSFNLLGHSMGGAVACLFAAIYPDRVKNLLLLDAVGPLVTPPEDAPAQMLRSLRQMQTLKPGYHHHYPDFMDAVKARADKGLSLEAATILGKRGILHDERGYYWNLDPRLSRANPLSLTEPQAAAFLSKISCPVLLIAAKEYWQEKQQWLALRRSYFHALEMHELGGNHHQHLDGQQAAVAELLNSFLAPKTS
jgi:pimeloyl-ACP methyl ester carboxylesterase